MHYFLTLHLKTGEVVLVKDKRLTFNHLVTDVTRQGENIFSLGLQSHFKIHYGLQRVEKPGKCGQQQAYGKLCRWKASLLVAHVNTCWLTKCAAQTSVGFLPDQ